MDAKIKSAIAKRHGVKVDKLANMRIEGDDVVYLVDHGIAGTKKYSTPLTKVKKGRAPKAPPKAPPEGDEGEGK